MSNKPVKYPKSNKERKPPVRSSSESNPQGGVEEHSQPEPTNWKGLIFFGLALGLVLAALWLSNHSEVPTKEISTVEFYKLLEENQKAEAQGKQKITQIVFQNDPASGLSYLKGEYIRGTTPDGKPVKAGFRTSVNLEFERNLQARLDQSGFQDKVNIEVIHNWWTPLLSFLPFALFLLILYFFFRQQIRTAGKSAFNFSKSKARMMNRDRNKVTFKDVAGIDEAKEELSEIVQFLKDPRKFQKLGGRIPKGVLMIGPPGTGKTLLGKAIAGEADVPFFSISGSDFVEMFVGVGASRVRDMFEQGKKSAPCLIFIDEIDAVGRSRGTGLGGGHDEREQTLNALLVEMDGIETSEGVIVLAATNRKDVLDPALLRSGRFDREVRVNLPDVKGRKQILEVHTRNVKLSPEVDLNLIARGTPGFSGAELANLVNESALLAAKNNKTSVEQEELEEARDKVRWGRERRSMAMTEEEKRTTAVHEAGHAILNILLQHTDPLHKVSIIPRGPALGVTMNLPEKDRWTEWRKHIIDQLCVIMGGRVAEEIFIGDISSGAGGDIQQATYYARKMVCEWGMSETLGMVHYADDSTMSFLGRDLGHTRSYSEKTAQAIDSEVLALVNHAYERAKELISTHREGMEKITEALLEYETLDGKDIKDIVEHGEMKNPPPKPISSPASELPQESLPVNIPPEAGSADDTLLPGLQGAPAEA